MQVVFCHTKDVRCQGHRSHRASTRIGSALHLLKRPTRYTPLQEITLMLSLQELEQIQIVASWHSTEFPLL